MSVACVTSGGPRNPKRQNHRGILSHSHCLVTLGKLALPLSEHCSKRDSACCWKDSPTPHHRLRWTSSKGTHVGELAQLHSLKWVALGPMDWPSLLLSKPTVRPWVNSSSIYPILYLMEMVKKLVLWNDTSKVSKTHGSHRISQRSSEEDSIMMVYQKAQALDQISDSFRWTFDSKPSGTKRCTPKSPLLPGQMKKSWTSRKGESKRFLSCGFCFGLFFWLFFSYLLTVISFLM